MEKEERSESKNVLGQPLQQCGCTPMTGFYRDGFCETGARDVGSHIVCAVMTEESSPSQRSAVTTSPPLPHTLTFPALRVVIGGAFVSPAGRRRTMLVSRPL